MILAALAPSFAALAIFFGSTRTQKRRGLTEKECQAASTRVFDGPRANVVIVAGLLAWGLLVIAAVHVIAGRTNWLPLELS